MYARRGGRNSLDAGRQEELLKDARVWAATELTEKVSPAENLGELKDWVVKQTWDRFVAMHRHRSHLQLGYREFATALWHEGWPPLEETARSRLSIGSSTVRPSLSSRDEDVHDEVGEERFCDLTNAQIRKELKVCLRDHFDSPDAAKCSLDRIRRAKGYPSSREILRKRSTRK
jgi:hypothetical protein